VSESISRSRRGESLLTIEEVANQLNVGERFVRRLVAERRIGFLKVGRYVRFHRADVEALIEAGRVENSSGRGAAR
jgi:excisionase family DNA binding protein